MNTEETSSQSNADPQDNTTAPRAVDWQNPRVAAILSAAATCFARKGFSATTLAEIGKELGLRKSIVHYYFASKAALIHEVQSFTYHKYLDRLKEALQGDQESGMARGMAALGALWEAIQGNKTGTGLNIEVWSAARRDPEIKRRASALQRDARKALAEKLPEVLGPAASSTLKLETLAALILATVNGLAVSEYLEGEEIDVKEAYDLFLQCLRARVEPK
jgi:TetR/AcrR family transcriptional regulator, repressor for uid operon